MTNRNMPADIKPKTTHNEFFLRKMAKAGSSRYLSLNTILPKDWVYLKVSVLKLEGNICVIKLERID